MNARSLRKLLRSWFAAQVDDAPDDDPRRTPRAQRGSPCPSIPETMEIARGERPVTPEEQKHQDTCAWCRRALATARLLVEQESADSRVRTAARLKDTAPDAAWPEQLQRRLVAWLQGLPIADAENAPAYFDDDSTLHVSWRGVLSDGAVKVSLRTPDGLVQVAQGVVRDGTLKLAAPLPGLGLRGVKVPPSALVVEPESQIDN